MISIIVCSQFSRLDEGLLQNIKDTIGVDFEIVHIDNSQRKYTIFEAYNLGVERAHGEFLCFMHEDVIFHSTDWGKSVERYLSQNFVGALGVAGSNVVLDSLDWRFYGFHHVYLIQGICSVEEYPQYSIVYYPPRQKYAPLCQVAAIDGVWMCMRKEMFKEIRFDDVNFHDFHLYDTDISMQVNKTGRGIFLTQDVLLEHKSYGTFTPSYRDSLEIFFKKWHDSLPMMKGAVIAQSDIDRALSSAKVEFDRRLEQDVRLTELRKAIKDKMSGAPCREYTVEEIQMMDDSAFRSRLRGIKDRHIPRSVAKGMLREYVQSSFAQRKLKLMLKYFWYRCLLCR